MANIGSNAELCCSQVVINLSGLMVIRADQNHSVEPIAKTIQKRPINRSKSLVLLWLGEVVVSVVRIGAGHQTSGNYYCWLAPEDLH